jgi:hypothetical protein
MAAGVMGLGAGAPVAAAGASARTNVVVTLIDDHWLPDTPSSIISFAIPAQRTIL